RPVRQNPSRNVSRRKISVQRADHGVEFCPPWNSDRNPRRRGGVNVPAATDNRPAVIAGAGEGNRTLVISLEGFCSTIELHPSRHSAGRKIAHHHKAARGGTDCA